MGPSQISVKYPITLETLILVPSTPAKNKTKKHLWRLIDQVHCREKIMRLPVTCERDRE